MKVYVLTFSNEMGTWIIGVYATLEAAQATVEMQQRTWDKCEACKRPTWMLWEDPMRAFVVTEYDLQGR